VTVPFVNNDALSSKYTQPVQLNERRL
jgi:hypothetical protein